MPLTLFRTAVEAGLDRSSPIPLWFQLAKILEESIVRGDVTPGTLLPNEVELAASLGLSRPTMRRAMEHLVDEGLIVRRRGIGTRVVQPKVRRPLELTSLFEDLDRTKRKPRTDVLDLELVAATSEVSKTLGVAPHAQVTKLVRLRWAGDLPIAVMTNYVPVDLAPLSSSDLERHGLYQLLRQSGVTLHSANQVIGARSATSSEATLLDEPRRSAVLTMERTAYDDHGRAVEFGTHVYAASRYSFELSLVTH